MKLEAIKAMQRRVSAAGHPLGEIDGFWGPRSSAACQAYLRSLMPSPNPWPKADESSLLRFYGKAGDESNLTMIVFPFAMFYEGKLVQRTRVHEKCAVSLLRVLNDIKERFQNMPDVMDQAQDYGGIYNNRAMRGGTRPSLHARGAAIDLSPGENGNFWKWPEAASMPIQIMECFAREGWKSAGAFWLRDAMHHECTS